MNELLRFKAVQQAVSLSRTTLWRLERAGQFPKRRQLSANTVGWLKSEVDSWINNRAVAGRTK
jgi:prophage regulatory protein